MRNEALLVVGADSDIGAKFLAGWEGPAAAHYFASFETLEPLLREGITPVKGDLSSLEGIEAFLRDLDATGLQFEKILFLPSMPAVPTKFRAFDPVRFEREWNVGLLSAAMLFKHLLPGMAKRGGGRVAAMLTSYVLGVPPKFVASYVTVKYALEGLIKAMAVEYGPKGITFNGCAPSMIETKFLSTLPGFEIEANAKRSPIGRNATPEDILPVLRLMLADESEFLNGAVIPVTAGGAF